MKAKSIFICQQCGARSARWVGKCPNCGAWDSYTEEAISVGPKNIAKVPIGKNKPVRLSEINTDGEFRLATKIKELDRVLGGGIIPGSLILVGGDPGIGKSTLMLQMCTGLKQFNPFYITGEESLQQIKYRSKRISGIPDDILLLAETNIEQIDYAIKSSDCNIAIVDSIQSVYTEKIESTPGSVSQVRECTGLLMQTAKQTGKAIFIIGHVTKEGVIAGPKILEHMVDTVLMFEGEKTYSYRILRATKNRFGSTNEIGIFEMSGSGLKQVSNPSELFLAQRQEEDSGVAIVAAIEGTRPILLEVQALVSPSGFAVPQRTANGVDVRRLNMILAVLEKRLGLKFRQYDVFVNIAGGVYISDPAIDLGIAAALVSSLRDKPIHSKAVLIGEIGLTGEVRAVSAIEQRIKEAEKLGFNKIILPKHSHKKLQGSFKVAMTPVERISLALADIF
ncbi:MAG: DNA repair protein RadA [bacterium]